MRNTVIFALLLASGAWAVPAGQALAEKQTEHHLDQDAGNLIGPPSAANLIHHTEGLVKRNPQRAAATKKTGGATSGQASKKISGGASTAGSKKGSGAAGGSSGAKKGSDTTIASKASTKKKGTGTSATARTKNAAGAGQKSKKCVPFKVPAVVSTKKKNAAGKQPAGSNKSAAKKGGKRDFDLESDAEFDAESEDLIEGNIGMLTKRIIESRTPPDEEEEEEEGEVRDPVKEGEDQFTEADKDYTPCYCEEQFTLDFFHTHAKCVPVDDTCVFYTAGMSQEAQNYCAQNFNLGPDKLEPGEKKGLRSIWDMWPGYLYNKKQVASNPMRCIIQPNLPHHPKDKYGYSIMPKRTRYFKVMSKAFATMCGGRARVLEKSFEEMQPEKRIVKLDSIWGEVEYPTLAMGAEGSYQGRKIASTITAMSGQGAHRTAWWTRGMANPPPIPSTFKRGIAANETSEPKVFAIRRELRKRLADCQPEPAKFTYTGFDKGEICDVHW